MSILRPLTLFLAAFVGTACASPPVRYANVTNPHYGQVEFDRDWYECQRENTHVGTYVNRYYGTSGPEVDYTMVRACMRARGWQQSVSVPQPQYVPSVSAPPPASAPPPQFTPVPTPSPAVPTTTLPGWKRTAPASSSDPGKKPAAKDVPLCEWGEYWHSGKSQCVKIGSE